QDREIRDVQELFDHRDSRKVRDGFDRLFAEVRTLRDEVRADGGSLAVLVFPFKLQVLPGAPTPPPQQTIGAFCAAEHIPFQDLLPALRPLGETGYIDYDHFSPAGARRVAEHVLESGWLDSAGGGEGAAPAAAAPARDPLDLPRLRAAVR